MKPWQPTAVPGPIVGMPVEKPAVIGKMIKNAKRPLLIVGGYEYDVDVGNGQKYVDLIVKIAKKGIPVVATSNISKILLEKGVKPVAITGVSDVINRICDETWKGYDGKGNYNVIIIGAMVYYLQSQAFSALKNYAYKWAKSTSLDRYYQPNASFALMNLKVDEWVSAINEIVNIILE